MADRWTPEAGTAQLVELLGRSEAFNVLVDLLAGEVSGAQLLEAPFHGALLAIGNGHAYRLMADRSGGRLAYWPRAWAARGLGYLGESGAELHLAEALHDDHWRVRMNAVQALGKLDVDGVEPTLVAALDDAHERVSRAAVIALGKTGGEAALGPLASLAAEAATDDSFRRLDRAIARIEKRIAWTGT